MREDHITQYEYDELKAENKTLREDFARVLKLYKTERDHSIKLSEIIELYESALNYSTVRFPNGNNLINAAREALNDAAKLRGKKWYI